MAIPAPNRGEITGLLQLWCAGNRDVEGRLFDLISPDLRRIARSLTTGRGRDHTPQATALVHDLYVRLIDGKGRDFPNRKAFYRYAALAMEHLLIDEWRRRRHLKMVPWSAVSARAFSTEKKIALGVAISAALEELEKINPDWCTLVRLRFYMELNHADIAKIMGISLRSVERSWEHARGWLFEKLGPGPWRMTPE